MVTIVRIQYHADSLEPTQVIVMFEDGKIQIKEELGV